MAGIIGSIFNGLGNLISNGFQSWTQSGSEIAAQKFNAAEAEKQRTFEAEQAQIAHERQRELRQTYYQDNVASMEASGINPAMALTNSGSIGAGTPSASSATGHSASINNTGHNETDIPGIINSIANVARIYNNDKDHTNNLSLTQAVGMLANVAKIFK